MTNRLQMVIWMIQMSDDYLDGDYMSDEYYDGHYCSSCGLEMTLDEYLEHDLDVCMEDYYEDE